MGLHFGAPWSAKLKAITVVVLALSAYLVYAERGWGSLLLVAIVLGTAVFAIRGYSVKDGQLLIHRLGWATKYPLAELARVELSPGITMGSLRMMGIGGLFGFVGHYRNAILGSYKAYATNDMNSVVLVFGDETIVVTPDNPVSFVSAVEDARLELSKRSARGQE